MRSILTKLLLPWKVCEKRPEACSRPNERGWASAPDGADRRDRREWNIHQVGASQDGRVQRAPGDIRAEQPDVEGRVHGHRGLHRDRRPLLILERQPVCARYSRLQDALSVTGQQRVHFPRRRARYYHVQVATYRRRRLSHRRWGIPIIFLFI